MKILLLSEDTSVCDETSSSRAKILEYGSLVDMFFVVVTTNLKKRSVKAKEVNGNTWIYQTNSVYKFLHIFDIFKLVSFELKNKNIFQADIIVSEAEPTIALAGYILSKKFKRPLYMILSEANERMFFAPAGLKNFLLSKIIWFVLINTDCIKVDSFATKERLRKRFSLRNHTIQVIKPFLNPQILITTKSKTFTDENAEENNFIKRKFPEFKFTVVAFVDNTEQVRLSLEILKNLNKHFPPTYLVLLNSYNLKTSGVSRLVRRNLRSFVRVENINEDLREYLTSSNVFFGLSEGEKYEEILIKACAFGTTIIALESNLSKQFIEDGVTGIICPILKMEETVDYFTSKTLFLMKNPVTSIGFKMNIAYTFKNNFSSNKEEYLNKVKSSWKECLERYERSRLKFYRY